MTLISDGLLIAGALAAAFYCFVLARRVRTLGRLDRGLGSAISRLSQQVEDLQAVLTSVKAAAGTTQLKTDAAAERAERAANRLQLLLTTTQLADEAGRASPARAMQSRDGERVAVSGARQSVLETGEPQRHRTAPQPGELA